MAPPILALTKLVADPIGWRREKRVNFWCGVAARSFGCAKEIVHLSNGIFGFSVRLLPATTARPLNIAPISFICSIRRAWMISFTGCGF